MLTSTAALTSSPATIRNFGLMGKKFAALGDLAQWYWENPSADPSPLNHLVAKQFPWWDPSTLEYFPWKANLLKRDSLVNQSTENRGTGIVLCAGNDNAREAAHFITTIRNVVHSKLPIDVAYVGDTDLDAKHQTFLGNLGVDINFIDLTKVFSEKLSGYATKPFALLASRYPRTILVDSDTVFFSAPDTIFEDFAPLAETGALFFHDRSIVMGGAPDRADWVKAQLTEAGWPPSAHLNRSSLFYRNYISEEADAGVVCIDKSRPRMYMAMVFAAWINSFEVRDAVTYQMGHGDKDSYWWATELSGVPYVFWPWSSARLAQLDWDGKALVVESGTRGPKNRRFRDGLGHDFEIEVRHSPPEKRCTTHMVHPRDDLQEPLWVNGGLWLDKRWRELGLVDWTHWYVGERIDEAISKYENASLTDLVSANEEQDMNELKKQAVQELIMNTQPAWLNHDWDADAKGCPQHHEGWWRTLSPGFRERVSRMVEEIRQVEIILTSMK